MIVLHASFGIKNEIKLVLIFWFSAYPCLTASWRLPSPWPQVLPTLPRRVPRAFPSRLSGEKARISWRAHARPELPAIHHPRLHFYATCPSSNWVSRAGSTSDVPMPLATVPDALARKSAQQARQVATLWMQKYRRVTVPPPPASPHTYTLTLTEDVSTIRGLNPRVPPGSAFLYLTVKLALKVRYWLVCRTRLLTAFSDMLQLFPFNSTGGRPREAGSFVAHKKRFSARGTPVGARGRGCGEAPRHRVGRPPRGAARRRGAGRDLAERGPSVEHGDTHFFFSCACASML